MKKKYDIRTKVACMSDGQSKWLTLGHVWENENDTLSGYVYSLPIGHVGPLDIVLFPCTTKKESK